MARALMKSEIIQILSLMELKVDPIMKNIQSLMELEQLTSDLNSYGDIGNFVSGKLKIREDLNRILFSAEEMTKNCMAITEKIAAVKKILNATEEKEVQVDMLMISITEIVNLINDIAKKVKDKKKDIITNITANTTVKSSIECIKDIIQNIETSLAPNEFKDKYKQYLWEQLWAGFDRNSAYTEEFEKIKIFFDNFFLIFLSKVTHHVEFNLPINNQLREDFLAFLKTLDYQQFFKIKTWKQKYTPGKKIPELEAELWPILEKLLIAKNLIAIVNMYQPTMNTSSGAGPSPGSSSGSGSSTGPNPGGSGRGPNPGGSSGSGSSTGPNPGGSGRGPNPGSSSKTYTPEEIIELNILNNDHIVKRIYSAKYVYEALGIDINDNSQKDLTVIKSILRNLYNVFKTVSSGAISYTVNCHTFKELPSKALLDKIVLKINFITNILKTGTNNGKTIDRTKPEEILTLEFPNNLK